ncbi:MAG: hypothetical protein K6C32_00550 [Bacilli bacterium]|nr:hypothetical protein [Bacilli bacterium]
MHSELTPFRICRNAIIGLVLSLGLLITTLCLPFYSYRYFTINETMKFIDVAKANHHIAVPLAGAILALVFIVAAVILMLFVSKNKIVQFVAKTLTILAAFAFIGLFFTAAVRLLVIPYEFDYIASQTLESGYLVYLAYLLFSGVLSCYILAIHEK